MKYVTRDRIGARRTIIKAETFEQIIAELYSFHTERLAEYPWIYPKNPDRFSEICYDHADRDPKTRVVTGFTQRPDDRLPFIILMHHFHWNEGARTAYTVGYGIPESRGRKPYLARFQEPWELIPWL